MCTTARVLHFASKQVKTLEDLKGLKVRAPTRIGTKVLTALGAVPVQMPAPQVPEALAKGVVDGVSFPWEVVPGLKIQEIAKTHTDTPPGQPYMSEHDLRRGDEPGEVRQPAAGPEEGDRRQQRARRVEVGGQGLGRHHRAGAQARARPRQHDQRADDAEFERWKKATENVEKEWFTEVGAKGGNGPALLDDAKALIKKYGG